MNRIGNGISTRFGRQLTLAETQDYRESVDLALKRLGKNRVALIAHAPAFPDSATTPMPVGSPLTRGGQAFNRFVAGLGFNRLQLGPNGIVTPYNPSPYNSSVFSKNPLLINLDKLGETHFWNKILPAERLARLALTHKADTPEKTDYSRAFKLYDTALREAFANFKTSSRRILKMAFLSFEQENREWLEKDGLYTVLSQIHGNDYWPNWPSELDRNLFNAQQNDDIMPMQALLRRQELKQKHHDELEYQNFVQFVAHWQWKQGQAIMKQHGLLPMGDSPIAFSDRDVWGNRHLFLEDWRMGAPPDEFAKDGQAWGFNVLNPETILGKPGFFLHHTKLAAGGELLKAKFEKLFSENPGGVRIDHVIGLIDPWVYSQQAGFNSTTRPAARLYSSPEDTALNPFSIPNVSQVDTQKPPEDAHRVRQLSAEQVERYAAVLDIIKNAAQKYNIPLENIICEDLGGALTTPVEKALAQSGLGGVRVNVFAKAGDENDPNRLRNVEAPHWVSTGSHDNQPLLRWAEAQVQSEGIKKLTGLLAKDLLWNNSVFYGFRKKRQWQKNPEQLATAKLAELFSSKSSSVQIFVNDLLGITEPYNQPGTSSADNWTQRIPQAFERFYHDQLVSGKALNLPEVLAMALQARGEDGRSSALIKTLKTLARTLKEPELKSTLVRSA